MNLEIDKIYKVQYPVKLSGGILQKLAHFDFYKDEFIGKYVGIAEDEYESLPCVVCGAQNHKKGYQFNSYYGKGDLDYETFNIGTGCIHKCTFIESTQEDMLNH